MGPRCHTLCLSRETGEFLWGIDLVEEYGTKVPKWYTGQCPLIDGDRLIWAGYAFTRAQEPFTA